MNSVLQFAAVAAVLSIGICEHNIFSVNGTASPQEENSPDRLLSTHVVQTTTRQEAEEAKSVAPSVREAHTQVAFKSEPEEFAGQKLANMETEEPNLGAGEADDSANHKPSGSDRNNNRTDDFDRNEKILAFYTTKTKALIATSTALMLSTCFSTTNTPSCTGRRKRNAFRAKVNSLTVDENGELLSSSLKDNMEDPDFNVASDGRAPSGRKFTIWSTLFSTYTVVTTSFYEGTTVTVSALCNPGFAASCFG